MELPPGALPADDPRAPRYWMHETSGVLAPVIRAYLNRLPFGPVEVATMRAYLRQWINSPTWDMNPHIDENGKARLEMLRQMIPEIRTRENVDQWLQIAMEAGIDPL